MILLLSLTLVYGGELADGFVVPFGRRSVLDVPPLGTCEPDSDPGIVYRCTIDLGEAHAVVRFSASERWYDSVIIETQGAVNSRALVTWAVGHYGPDREGRVDNRIDDRVWVDGHVGAVFRYDGYSRRGTMSIIETTMFVLE